MRGEGSEGVIRADVGTHTAHRCTQSHHPLPHHSISDSTQVLLCPLLDLHLHADPGVPLLLLVVALLELSHLIAKHVHCHRLRLILPGRGVRDREGQGEKRRMRGGTREGCEDGRESGRNWSDHIELQLMYEYTQGMRMCVCTCSPHTLVTCTYLQRHHTMTHTPHDMISIT